MVKVPTQICITRSQWVNGENNPNRSSVATKIMMTSLNGNIFSRHWSFVRGIHRAPVNSPHKGQWREALVFSLICVWINDWVNNREVSDLRRHRTHYDVIVIILTALLLHWRIGRLICQPHWRPWLELRYRYPIVLLYTQKQVWPLPTINRANSTDICCHVSVPMTATEFLCRTTWRRYDREALSTLLALCEGNPSVTGEFSRHKSSNVEVWSEYEHAVEQAVASLVTGDVMTLMWRHNNAMQAVRALLLCCRGPVD